MHLPKKGRRQSSFRMDPAATCGDPGRMPRLQDPHGADADLADRAHFTTASGADAERPSCAAATRPFPVTKPGVTDVRADAVRSNRGNAPVSNGHEQASSVPGQALGRRRGP